MKILKQIRIEKRMGTVIESPSIRATRLTIDNLEKDLYFDVEVVKRFKNPVHLELSMYEVWSDESKKKNFSSAHLHYHLKLFFFRTFSNFSAEEMTTVTSAKST